MNKTHSKVFGVISFIIVFCLIVLSGIFLNGGYNSKQDRQISSNVSAANEVTLLKNWLSRTGYSSSASIRSVTLTKDATKIPDTSESNLYFVKEVRVGASSADDTVFDDTVDLTAYVTKTSLTSSNLYYEFVIYSPSNILAPVDSTSLFALDNCTTLNLENFSTKNTVNMTSMFRYLDATSLNLGACDFVTTQVKYMQYMFSGTKLKTAGVNSSTVTYNLNFGDYFSTANVENMSYMFAGYDPNYSHSYNSSFQTINLSFSRFNTLKVTDMSGMFYACTSLTSLTFNTSFNTRNVVNMSSMFNGCYNLKNLNLASATFNTSNVTNMNSMFRYTGFVTAGTGTDFNLNFGTAFDVSKVTNFSYMFAKRNTSSNTDYGSWDNYLVSADLSSWHCSNQYIEDMVVTFEGMFCGSSRLKTISFGNNFYVNNVTNMSYMFCGCRALTDVNFGTHFMPNASINFSYMFYYCTSIVGIDFTYFGTSSATNMSYMFYNCYNLTSLDLRSFDTSNVTNFSYMFAVENGVTSRLANLTLNFNTSSARNMSFMFYRCSGLTSLELSSFNTSNVTNMAYMFNECSGLSGVGSNNAYESYSLNLGDGFYTLNVENMQYMFNNCSAAQKFDLSIFNTQKVTNISYMFAGCNSAKSIVLGPNFTTQNITNMVHMFHNCSSLNGTLDLRVFSSDKISTVEYMFCNCGSLKHILFGDDFTIENVTNATHLFDGCESLANLDVSMFDTSKITNMSYMFSRCATLQELNLSNFDTSNVTTMWNMFSRCAAISSVGVSDSATSYALNLGTNFDTSNVTDMSSMFAYCSSAKVIMLGEKFQTGEVRSIGSMFFNCSSLEDASAVKGFDTTNVKDMSSLFGFCSSLKSIDLSSFEISSGTVIVGIIDACTGLDSITCPRINATNLTADLPTIFKAGSNTYRQLSSSTNGKVLQRAGNFLYSSFRVVLGSEICQRVATITVTSNLKTSAITKTNFSTDELLTSGAIGGIYSVGTANTSGTLYSNTSMLKAYMLQSSYVDENGDYLYDCVIYSKGLVVYAPERCEFLFAGKDDYKTYFSSLKEVHLDGLDTTNSTTFRGMFSDCEELTSLEVNRLNITNVTNFNNMLKNCGKLSYIYTFDNNGYDIQLPGVYFDSTKPTSTEEYTSFPARTTKLTKRFVISLDISNTDNFSATGWRVVNEGLTAQKTYNYGETIGNLPIPVRGNRVFDCWGTIDEDENFIPFTLTKFDVLHDISLVQNWKKVNITFNLDGGFYDTSHVFEATETTEKEFVSELNGTREVVELALMELQDAPANWSSIFNGLHIEAFVGDEIGILPFALKDDHDFLGWKFGNGTFALSSVTVPLDANAGVGEIGEVQLFASWIFNEHPENWRHITYIANGGRIDAYKNATISSETVVEYSEEVEDFVDVIKVNVAVSPSNPAWEVNDDRDEATKRIYVGRNIGNMAYAVNGGYKFVGWYTEEEGGELVVSSDIISSNMTLYAHWEKIDEDYAIDQKSIIIIGICVVGAGIVGLSVFLIIKLHKHSAKSVSINEKFIQDFNENNGQTNQNAQIKKSHEKSQKKEESE